MSVLVCMSEADEPAPLVRWGARFARARRTQLIVLRVEAGRTEEVRLAGTITACSAGEQRDSVALAANVALGEVQRSGLDESQEVPADAPWLLAPRYLHAAGPDRVAVVLREICAQRADLVVCGKHQKTSRSVDQANFTSRLLRRAPCDVVVLRSGLSGGKRCEQIVCPAAGGPHARVALKLSEHLALCYDARVTALYVEPDMGLEAREVGERRIRQSLREAGVKATQRVTCEVVVADNVTDGIRRGVGEECDLLLVGASETGMRRVLFGTIPDALLEHSEGTTVAVLRRARPLRERVQDRVERFLQVRVPQLERADRVALFDRLQGGSRFDFDFMAMIALSTAIASLGLIQNAAAVVIGAMLVAPLMTPMLGAGLSLVQGNLPLVREAARAIVFGFLVALGIGFLAGVAAPIHALTPELLARGAPNLLDLFVALFSGVAAAYAMGRPNLSSALPGVAIAAALVPPIGTVGISLALGETGNARGAAALFGTNLIAIVLGSALCLYVIGVRGNREHGRGWLWGRRAILGLILTAVVIAFPLGSHLLSPLAEVRAKIPVAVRDDVGALVARQPGARLVSVERAGRTGDELHVNVVVAAPTPLPVSLADELARALQKHFERSLTVQLRIELSTVSSSGGAGRARVDPIER